MTRPRGVDEGAEPAGPRLNGEYCRRQRRAGQRRERQISHANLTGPGEPE